MRKNKTRRGNPLVHIGVVIVALGLAVGVWHITQSGDRPERERREAAITPNMTEVAFFDFFPDRSPRNIHLMLGDTFMTAFAEPTIIGGELHIPADFLRTHINQDIFWEPRSNRLSITTISEVIRFTVDEHDYRINDDYRRMDFPIRRVGDMGFMAASEVMARFPGVSISQPGGHNIVIVELFDNDIIYYRVSDLPENGNDLDWVPLRAAADIQSPILARLSPGDSLRLFGVGDNDEFLFVRTTNGLLGYVSEDFLDFVDFTVGIPRPDPPIRPQLCPFGRPFTVLWQQVTNPVAAADTYQWRAIPGVDVLSPTWFSFDADALNGDIIDIGNRAYVDWARANGIAVWPLIKDNFCYDVSHAVLTCAYVREHVIAQLMHFADIYGFDGINVDYEAVRVADSEYWIQFLRELAVPMAERDLVLSVAAFVPAPWQMHYNRTEIARTADFLMIMAYDEHYQRADRLRTQAGPVASYNFVRNAIIGTLREMPSYRVLVSVPFYERIWREEPYGDTDQVLTTSVAVGMAVARNRFINNGATFVWDETIRKYYAEYYAIEGGVQVRYRVWLECLRSMRQRLYMVDEFQLAGVAGWRKGLELLTVWDVIADFVP